MVKNITLLEHQVQLVVISSTSSSLSLSVWFLYGNITWLNHSTITAPSKVLDDLYFVIIFEISLS